MRYFNYKSSQGIETVDCIDREYFDSYRDFLTEVNRLKSEYRTAGMNVYLSQRSTKDWRDNQ